MGCKQTGAIIVSHGSSRDEANREFEEKIKRVITRLSGMKVKPAFFSMASPTLSDRIDELAEQGIERVLILPYFLHNGQHIINDLPEQIDVCRREHPEIQIEQRSTLQEDPALEDILVHRLAEYVQPSQPDLRSGGAIENRSREIIDGRLSDSGWEEALPVVRRVVHATADFSFADTLRVHPEAIEVGVTALGDGGPVVCDVNMLRSGITRVDCDVMCAIGDEDVARQAAGRDMTRSAAAMEKLSAHIDDAVVAIGNAPTALWKVLQMAEEGRATPRLVVGVPVGFVGAMESKLALLNSDLCYITNVGNRGGTPVAASVVNALANDC
ncbi:MAG: precorrin-8X methylmutase [Candidatus Brocadiia bacterium]